MDLLPIKHAKDLIKRLTAMSALGGKLQVSAVLGRLIDACGRQLGDGMKLPEYEVVMHLPSGDHSVRGIWCVIDGKVWDIADLLRRESDPKWCPTCEHWHAG